MSWTLGLCHHRITQQPNIDIPCIPPPWSGKRWPRRVLSRLSHPADVPAGAMEAPRFGHHQRHHALPRSMASMAMAVYAGPTDVGSVSFQVCLHEAYMKHIYVHCPHGNVGRIHRSTVDLLTCLFTTYRAGWLGVRCLGNLMVTMFCRCNPNLYVASRAHTKKGDDVVGW